MGHIVHHAIVVTSWDEKQIEAAIGEAVKLGCRATSIAGHMVNGGGSFLVAPDGSKSGWPESDVGDAQRTAFIAWLVAQRYEDGSSSLCWVEIEYGSDDARAIVKRNEWKDRKRGEHSKP